MLDSLPGKKPFLLGIGGSGMSAIAHLLVDMGFAVSGYDKKDSSELQKLSERGIAIYGPADDLPEVDYAVYSTAINRLTHPVYLALKEKKIPLFHRSEVLHCIFSKKTSISVAGSHGKTSTTGMMAQVLLQLEPNSTMMLGGEFPFLQGKGGKWGEGEYGVYESDESDGTFLNHTASVRIVTNIDDDHLDFYKTKEKLLQAFSQYMQQDIGSVIVNFDNAEIRELLVEEKAGVSVLACGENTQQIPDWLDFYPIRFADTGVYLRDGAKEVFLQIPIPGKHYLQNACLAYLALRRLGFALDSIQTELLRYQGVKRRLEFLGEWQGIRIFDDYGHHPTEVLAVLQSLRPQVPAGSRLCVLFQPHRFTRTRNLYKEFAEALREADVCYLLPIYSAGEEPIQGVSSELIQNLLPDSQLLTRVCQEGISYLRQKLQVGDILLCLGAGDVYRWGEAFGAK
ncbi:MAG: UDP-N-acetylmuramate--L-alanine ligase [Spirochaetota bacterium]